MDFIVPEIQSDLVKASGLVFNEDVTDIICRDFRIEKAIRSETD